MKEIPRLMFTKYISFKQSFDLHFWNKILSVIFPENQSKIFYSYNLSASPSKVAFFRHIWCLVLAYFNIYFN